MRPTRDVCRECPSLNPLHGEGPDRTTTAKTSGRSTPGSLNPLHGEGPDRTFDCHGVRLVVCGVSIPYTGKVLIGQMNESRVRGGSVRCLNPLHGEGPDRTSPPSTFSCIRTSSLNPLHGEGPDRTPSRARTGPSRTSCLNPLHGEGPDRTHQRRQTMGLLIQVSIPYTGMPARLGAKAPENEPEARCRA